jgi:hypothetical protein
MKEQSTKPIDQGFIEQDTALESMRASDFDCYSAYGEVIDNSIQAFADDIRIKFEEKQDRTARSKQIGRVIFTDNGDGMDINLLHKCLKLGHSSRYNDRSGIGRFGVGMTLGAIHECRRVEVYSKTKSSTWNYTYLDLDEIKSGNLKYLPYPKEKKPNFNIADYIDDSGTVVVWSKYDKQVYRYEDIIKESRFWIGRTFRKFLWGEAEGYDKVKISLNGKTIKAFDPLFVNKESTGYEDEPQAELLEPQKIEWTVPLDSNSKKQKSAIILNVSLLPDEYRRERGKGGDTFAKDRYINRNEGISILRNDREVFFGHIPYATELGSSEANKNINRFIGAEISFKADLDNEFDVKNIKRGAVPVRDLKKEIVDRWAPTFRTLRSKIQDRWNKLDREINSGTSDKNKDIGVSGEHSTSNTLLNKIKRAALKNDKAGKKENDEKIARKIKKDADSKEISKIIAGLKENGITIDEKEFIGDSFIDIEHGNGFKTIFYNTNSTFYKAYKEILQEIQSKNEQVANDYRVLIDLIFVGYMLAESKIDPDEEIDGASFADEIKQYWALDLSKILKKWKD